MYFFTVQFFTLLLPFLQQHVRAEISPDSAKQEERQVTGDDSFCFGTDSICTYSINLFEQCSNYLNSNDMTKWYQCICGNGYVSVDES
jgi:hypothetical protein